MTLLSWNSQLEYLQEQLLLDNNTDIGKYFEIWDVVPYQHERVGMKLWKNYLLHLMSFFTKWLATIKQQKLKELKEHLQSQDCWSLLFLCVCYIKHISHDLEQNFMMFSKGFKKICLFLKVLLHSINQSTMTKCTWVAHFSPRCWCYLGRFLPRWWWVNSVIEPPFIITCTKAIHMFSADYALSNTVSKLSDLLPLQYFLNPINFAACLYKSTANDNRPTEHFASSLSQS